MDGAVLETTPMSHTTQVNKPDPVNPAITSRFQLGYHWRGVTDPSRSATSGRGLLEGHFDRGLRGLRGCFIRAIRVIRGYSFGAQWRSRPPVRYRAGAGWRFCVL
jgi:hypothetical protein